MVKCFRKLAIIVMVGLGFASYGKTVDMNAAMTVGSNFLISAGVAGVQGPTSLSLAYTATAMVKGNEVADFYVFNINGGKGFVMVSGDDGVIPILAYSDQAAFDISNISPDTKFWISGYKKQITAVIENEAPAKASTTQRWNELQASATHTTNRVTSSGVAPLLGSMMWNQSPYYNMLCPSTSTTGGLSVTGCVATAMAQVMKYWNWPSVGTGIHSYYDPTSNATLTANYGATAYQWSLMPNTVTFLTPSASVVAVSTLMLHAGISVNMSYSAAESGSYVISLETYGINCAQYALPTYFHYKPSLRGLSRFGEVQGYGDPIVDSIAETTWIAMLQTELNAGHPIIYDGEEPAYAGGHCWVCDGWETSGNMFHFNWGWGGYNNGYYTVDNLAPSSLGTNLNLDQGAILGIVPDSFPSTPGNLQLLAPLDANVSSPMPYKSPFAITTKILNSDTVASVGDFCARVYNASNTLVCTIATITGDTIAAGDSATLSFSTAGQDSMVPYQYSIEVLHRAAGTTAWAPVANNRNYINYTVLGVNTDTDLVLYDSLHVNGHSIPSGSPVTVSTTIGNQSSAGTTFTGALRAVLINVTTGAQYTVQQHASQTIDTTYLGMNFTFTNSSMLIPVGLYALEVEHQYNGAGSFFTTSSDYYSNPVLLNVTAYTAVTTVATEANVYVYPNPAKDIVTIATEGQVINTIHIMDVAGHVVRSTTGAGQTLVSMPVNDLAAGIYVVQVQTATGTVTKKIVINK